MSRRRLLINSSSSDDDTIRINGPDEESMMDDSEPSDCPIGSFLSNLGLRLSNDWLFECVSGLEMSVLGFGGFDSDEKAKLCFERFLFSDMNRSGAGGLPGNVSRLNMVEIEGPVVVQVDEIVNMSCPLKGRYQAANPGLKRCLKLSMTDGVQRVFGMEYRPIKDLEVLAPAGLKIVLRNVQVRHGILMLVPEVVEILGGMVEDLESARQRLVQEVNKPPRGKRTKNGVVPPLATRASHAAWPPNGSSGPGPTNVTMPQTPPSRVTEPASTPSLFTRERNTQEFVVPNNTTNLQPNISPPVGNRRANLEPNLSSGVENSRDNFNSNISPPVGNRRANLEPNPSSDIENSRDNFDSNLSSTERNRRASVETNLSSTAGNSRTNFESHVSSTMASVETNLSSNAGNSWANVEPDLSSTAAPDVEEVQMTDDVDHPSILRGDTEFPFTYIASLSSKLATVKDKASYVQGTIKCFLTGVKGFQFRQRAKYELRAFVDDGSLISEILIDHNVVHKRVGHSPQEVTAALSSSDTKRVSEMKEILKQFQYFLLNFEGTMFVQISEASPYPTAMEMNQGCSTSDAWLLLSRLKSFKANQPQQYPSIEPIDLSP